MAQFNYPFPSVPQYLAVWLSYRNRQFIADDVMPRVPVEAETFKWFKYAKEQLFTLRETKVGRKGRPNQMEISATEESGIVHAYGMETLIPEQDVRAAESLPGYNPVSSNILAIREVVALGREKRVADLLFNPATYPAANRQTLSGSSQFSHADSDPFDLVMTALEGMDVRPNIAIINRPSWIKLRRNSKLTSCLTAPSNGNSSGQGAPASLQAVAELFELDAIYIGEGRYNSAVEGQSPTYTRLWGNHMCFLHQNPLTSLRTGGLTFGATAQWGPPVAGEISQPHVGLLGGRSAVAGEFVNELIIASDAGYFLQNVI